MSALDEVINNTPPAVGEMSELEGAKLGLTAPTPSSTPVIDAPLAAVFAASTNPAVQELVAQFKEADTPHANPPEAAKVLETQTAPEVAGNPEPLTDEQVAEIAKAEKLEEFNEARAARGEKPLKRMPPEKKTRRTAPVVQVELDAMALLCAGYEKQIAEDAAEIAAQGELIEGLRAATLIDRDQTSIDTIKALRINEARAAETVLEGCRREDLALDEVKRLNKRITALEAETSPESSTPIEILARECESRGWKVTLNR